MKQAILLFISATLSTFAFGQRKAVATHTTTPVEAARTTAVGDTTMLTNIAATDPLTLYRYTPNNGFTYGINGYGDMGFAERYEVNGSLNSVTVIGVVSKFGGHISPLSTNSINFMAWGLSTQIAITATTVYNSYPLNGLDTLSVPVTHLGIGTTIDSVKSFFFPRPTDTIQGAFFIGYVANYNFATTLDTFGLYSTLDGARTAPWYTIHAFTNADGDTTGYDTIINVQNATLWSDNNWHENYTQSDSIKNNLAIFPIVTIGNPTGVGSITKNNLTFFGNYPNPATDYTNIKFSLSKNADVTLTLMDLQGRIIDTKQLKAQTMGEHIINVPVSNLAAGNYIYTLVTSGGDAIASQMTVAR